MEYEAVIGLEVHVQLKTASKMFTRAPYQYGASPNTLIDPLVLGLPGTLPVMNVEAIHKTIQLGLMFGCTVADVCKWDRKNYFYPDLPKGYQISQFDQPLCLGGSLEIELEGPARNIMGKHKLVKLTRIHLEEDVGKLTHYEDGSLIDYNRAGTSLVEIVSEPDMHSPQEVFAYLTSLKMHLLYAGISDCDMEKGQLRCDANISIRPKGSTKLGTKVELKNLNSISGVRNGVAFEIKRQTKSLENGEVITQETRRWDAEKMASFPIRGKENAHDYRYFPDPDLMPVAISTKVKESLTKSLPELPFIKQERFFKEYDLPYTLTSVICPSKELSDYFEASVKHHNNPKAIANFIANDLLRELSNTNLSLDSLKISPAELAKLVLLVDNQVISKQIAQDVFIEMFTTGKDANTIVGEKGIEQNSDTTALEALCLEAIANHPKAIQEYKSGKLMAINALKGFVMKATKGKANPALIDTILTKLLHSTPPHA